MDDSDEFLDKNETTSLLGSRVTENGIYTNGRENHVEDPATYKSRWRSLRVMYFIQLLAALTFSITMSSLWPFLEVLKPSANASFLGWVVASYSLGQLVASPLLGMWANLRKSSKEPMLVSLLLGVFANVFYMYLQSLPDMQNYFMIVARGLIGVSAGNVAVLRSYVSGATSVKERTGCMANVSICQVIGFILGPVIQAALVPISYPGPVDVPAFHFNMYTSPAFISALASIASIVLMLFFFKEHEIHDTGSETLGDVQEDRENQESEVSSIARSRTIQPNAAKPDYVAVFATIYLFFTTLFMFTMLETIATPVTMHMYAWSKSRATFYQGFILGGGGIVSFIVFCAVKPLVKKFSERSLLVLGFVICFFGYFGFVSWGNKLPPLSPRPINNDSMQLNVSYSSFAHNTIRNLDTLLTPANFTKKYNSEDLPQNAQPKSGSGLLALLSRSHAEAFVRRKDITHGSEGESLPHEVKRFNSRNIQSGSDSDFASKQGHKQLQQTIYSMKSIKDSAVSKTGNRSRRTSPHSSILISNNIITASVSQATSMSTVFTMTTESKNKSKTTPGKTNSTTTPHPLTPEGCPWNYDWCYNTPVIYLAQYLCASMLVSTGYPLCQVFSYIIFSKVLGPAPQGLWMGWLTASGSLARTLGPIYISHMYHSYGPRVTYGSVAALIFLTIIVCLFVYRRLVPYSPERRPSALLRFGREKGNRSLG